MGNFTVIEGSEAGVDLVWIQTFLLYYVNQVVLMPTSIFQGQFPEESKGGLYQNKVWTSASHSLEGQGAKPRDMSRVSLARKINGKKNDS